MYAKNPEKALNVNATDGDLKMYSKGSSVSFMTIYIGTADVMIDKISFLLNLMLKVFLSNSPSESIIIKKAKFELIIAP